MRKTHHKVDVGLARDKMGLVWGGGGGVSSPDPPPKRKERLASIVQPHTMG